MSDALKNNPKPADALAQFDRAFSQLYVGKAVTSTGVAVSLLGSSLPNRTVPKQFLGEGGFKPIFQENTPRNDQTHHFATYLSIGINSTGGDYLNVVQRAHRRQDNDADRRLGATAFAMGQEMRIASPVGLANIGANIRSGICR